MENCKALKTLSEYEIIYVKSLFQLLKMFIDRLALTKLCRHTKTVQGKSFPPFVHYLKKIILCVLFETQNLFHVC